MFFYSPKLLLLALFFLGNFWQCASFQIPPSDQLKDVRHINKKIPDADVSIASTAAGDAVGVKYTCESYKEASRKFRRTVYDHEKWYKHRSSERHVKNLLTMFSSGIIRGLQNEVLTVTAVATFIVAWNYLVGIDGNPGIISLGDTKLPNLCMQTLPFTLSSSALGLLLVFRTNSAYSRWKDARIQWGGTINRSFDLVRGGLAYIGHDNDYKMNKELTDAKTELTLRTIAFARCLKKHFRDGDEEEEILRKELTELLGADEAERIMEAKHRPLRVVQDLSMLLRRCQLSPMQLLCLDKCVAFYCDSIGVCERIFKTPIPLVYTRHTSRFLTTWLLFLPLALYEVSGSGLGHLAVIPEATAIAAFFYGIEELGVQIEEPFSILAMEAFGDAIQRGTMEMLANDLAKYEYDSGAEDETIPEVSVDLNDSKWC